MLSYEPSYHDETLDPLIQQILPDIEQSLKKQLMAELQKQAQAEFQRQFAKIEQQAIDQYEIALHDLEEEGQKLFNQQTAHLVKQIEKLKKDLKNKEQTHIKHLEDRYISQNFQSLILTHPKISEIETQLAIEIIQNSQQKMEGAKQRRMREMAVKMQNKQQKLKVEKQKSIKNQIYQSRSLDELKKDIQIMKIGVASMKSQYNIKIKKIDEEIKAIKAKNKTLQPQVNIQDLRKNLQTLQSKIEQANNKQLNSAHGNNTSFNNNDTFSHLDSEAELVQHKNHFIQSQQREDVLEQEDRDSFSSSSSQNSEQNDDHAFVPKPPSYYATEQVVEENINTFENHTPILQLNVATLLRSNWEDPLEKYVNKKKAQGEFEESLLNESKSNENDSKVGNRLSFQEIYHQHLEKLNQGIKRRRLTAQAKKTIMRNLGVARKNKP